MKTLLVIYNHNLPDMTDKLWEELLPYKHDVYDMILIDNGSHPSGKSKYTTHETGKNTYFGGALNLALQYFLETNIYDSLLSMNNDLILQGPNFVKTLRKEMFDGDYKIISPCILQTQSQCYWRYMHCWNSNVVRDVKWVDFQSPLLHRTLIEHIQQFSNELIYGWGQDVYSGIVCEQNNWKVGVVDTCPLIHHSAATYKAGKSDIDVNTYHENASRSMYTYMHNNGLSQKLEEFRHLSRNYKYEV